MPIYYEMLWDCKFCGSKKLLAKSQPKCPNCGASQDPSWRYFPSDDEMQVAQGHQVLGANLICPACEAINAADALFCTNCGSPLAGAQEAPRVQSVVVPPGGFAGETLAERRAREQGEREVGDDVGEAALGDRLAIAPPPRSSTPRSPARSGSASRRPNPVIAGVRWLLAAWWRWATGLVAIAGLVLALFLWTHDVNVTVIGHDWERTIRVEEFRQVSESDWEGSVPSGAYGVSCSRQQRSTRQVPDGESCSTSMVNVDNGDGTFSRESRKTCTTKYRDEPVYDDWCRYTVDRWVFKRAAVAQGAALTPAPYWPDPQVKPCASYGCEREGDRQDMYRLMLRSRDRPEPYICNQPQADWSRTPLQTQFRLTVGSVFKEARCGSLQRLDR